MTDNDFSHTPLACTCSLHGRRRLGAVLAAAALAPAATWAQAEIPECRRSRAASLVPANQVESSAQQQYLQLLRQAKGEGALLPGTHPQMQRLRYIAEDGDGGGPIQMMLWAWVIYSNPS